MSKIPELYPGQRRENRNWWFQASAVAIGAVATVGGLAYVAEITSPSEPLTPPAPHKTKIIAVKTINGCDGNASNQKPTSFPGAPGYTESTDPNVLAQKQGQDPTNLGIRGTEGDINVGLGTLVCKEHVMGWIHSTDREWLTQQAVTVAQAQ